MKVNRKPGFFIVGAPKSGTTSLYFYLKQHPQIFLPRIKELNYFCTDLHFRYPLLNEEQFMDYYIDWNKEEIAGEVSVWNLMSAAAAKNIYAFKPDAKIIMVLRNPVDMLVALHSNHVFNNNETISDFEEAFHAQEERRKGNLISPTIKSPVEGLFYTDVASYATHLKRYLQTFGKEKVKVILFDDFERDAKSVYREILKFLEADESFVPDFRIYNARKTVKSGWLKSLTIDPPRWMKSVGVTLFPHQTKRRDWLMYWLWKINTKEVVAEKMNEGLEKKLLEQFTPEIERLEMLIGKNLAAWTK